MGAQFSTTGIVIKPALPARLGGYSFTSPIASIEYVASSTGEAGQSFYHGNYTAMSNGHWDVSIDLSLRHPGVKFEVRVRWLAQTIGGSHAAEAASVAVVAEATMNGTDRLVVAAPSDTAAYGLDFAIRF